MIEVLRAYNAEILALSQAGVPLDFGIPQTAGGMQPALDRINRVVAERMAEGASLESALDCSQDRLPATYRALVKSGLRCGRLPAALEAWNTDVTIPQLLCGALRAAFLYPALVCFLAGILFWGYGLLFVPILRESQQSLQVSPDVVTRLLDASGGYLPYGLAVFTGLLMTGAMVCLARCREWTTAVPSRRPILLRLLGATSILQMHANAKNLELLALLIAHQVPLLEALNLVAQASCDPRIETRVAAWPTSGAPLPDQTPPWARFLSLVPEPQVALAHPDAIAADLRTGAEAFRLDASQRIARLRTYLPVATCILIAGSVTLLFGLVIFAPVMNMLYRLASA